MTNECETVGKVIRTKSAPKELSGEDIQPAINLSLKIRQISTFEGVAVKTVHSWIHSGEFPEYTILPGKNEVRVPLWSYLEWRRCRRVRSNRTAGTD